MTAPVLSDGVATMVPGISEKSGGVTSTILPDRMGSMKGMANAGTVTETAEFDAFGKVIARTNPSATQKGFAGGFGYQEDGESGYKLLGHRYYDADTGRFLSRDMAKDGRNWYAYCENNPLKRIDPSGLSSLLNPANAAEAAACLAEIDGVAVGAGAAVALTPYEMAWGAYLGWYLRLPPSIQMLLGLLGIGGPVAGGRLSGSSPTATGAAEADEGAMAGRWMGQSEYNKMQATGRVQSSDSQIDGRQGNWGIMPPNPDSFRNPSKGAQFITFGLPKGTFTPAGNDWIKIHPIGGSRSGNEMPPFTNLSPWHRPQLPDR